MTGILVVYKGRKRPATDVAYDVGWDIEHGARASAQEGLNVLLLAALKTGDEQLRSECSRLSAMLEREQPPRSYYAGQPASSPNNLPTLPPLALTAQQKKLYMREAVREVMELQNGGSGAWTFSSGSLWKAIFRVFQEKGLCAKGTAEYSEFEKLAVELGFDLADTCRIPFTKSYIEDISKEQYKQFRETLSAWSANGLTGRSLSFAKSMIAVKDELLKRLEAMGVC